MTTISRKQKRDRRHGRIRAKVAGTAERPRLAVFRSNRVIYLQLIDDTKGETLAASSSKEVKGAMQEAARTVGADLAEKAKAKGVEAVVFDRGGFSYTGIVKAAADGAREGGLKF